MLFIKVTFLIVLALLTHEYSTYSTMHDYFHVSLKTLNFTMIFSWYMYQIFNSCNDLNFFSKLKNSSGSCGHTTFLGGLANFLFLSESETEIKSTQYHNIFLDVLVIVRLRSMQWAHFSNRYMAPEPRVWLSLFNITCISYFKKIILQTLKVFTGRLLHTEETTENYLILVVNMQRSKFSKYITTF